MTDEDAVLEEPMGNIGEASGRPRASRRLSLEHAMMDESRYLRLASRLSETLDATETASREVRRRCDAAATPARIELRAEVLRSTHSPGPDGL